MAAAHGISADWLVVRRVGRGAGDRAGGLGHHAQNWCNGIGDGIAGNALISGIARQPEAQGRLFTPFFITVGLVEAAYFINLAFMALFVFATPGAS